MQELIAILVGGAVIGFLAFRIVVPWLAWQERPKNRAASQNAQPPASAPNPETHQGDG